MFKVIIIEPTIANTKIKLEIINHILYTEYSTKPTVVIWLVSTKNPSQLLLATNIIFVTLFEKKFPKSWTKFEYTKLIVSELSIKLLYSGDNKIQE